MQTFLPSQRRLFYALFQNSKNGFYSKFKFSSAVSANSELAHDETRNLDEHTCLSSRVEKLKRGESIVFAFQSWMGEGSPVQRGDVFHTINRLRKLRMNRRALEVMEWVIREKPYTLKELDYSYLLEFTIKLHGIPRGETLFTRVLPEFKNELLYNNLVLGCLDKGVISLSLAYMKKMRELGLPISPLIYNRLILLHSSPARKKTIPRILTQMKADAVSPTPSTYNILLKLEAREHNIEGMAKVFNDMKRLNIEPNEITYCILATAHIVARLYTVSEAYVEAIERSKTGNNWSTLDVLVMLYGCLGKEKELEQTWRLVQNLPQVRYKSFLLAIEAFGRIGQVDRSKELWLEMKSKKKLRLTEQFNSIISVYCRNGFVSKASEVFKEMEMMGCEPNAITYRCLVLGCLKAGLLEEAVKTLDIGRDQSAIIRIRRSRPWLETTLLIIENFAELGDLENSKRLFVELQESRYSRYTFVYNALLRAYVKAKVYAPDFLREMILEGSRPDSETYSLVRLMEQVRP